MFKSNPISWNRVYAIFLRLVYSTLRSYDRLTDAFYWITLDLILWGVTAGYVANHLNGSQLDIYSSLICGVLMWNITYRANNDVGIALLDEVQNKNLVNLFASPLKVAEFITAVLIFAVIKCVIAVSFGTLVAWILYDFNLVSSMGWHLIPFFVILLINGWWIGFVVQSIILLATTKAQSVAWTLIWTIAPLSAIYFPVDTLPYGAQVLTKLVPTSYVFEGMRAILFHQPISVTDLYFASGLSLIYLALSIALVARSFKSILKIGLVKVY